MQKGHWITEYESIMPQLKQDFISGMSSDKIGKKYGIPITRVQALMQILLDEIRKEYRENNNC